MLDEKHFAIPPAPTEDEIELIGGSEEMQTTSRLSRQVPLSDELDDMIIKVAPLG